MSMLDGHLLLFFENTFLTEVDLALETLEVNINIFLMKVTLDRAGPRYSVEWTVGMHFGSNHNILIFVLVTGGLMLFDLCSGHLFSTMRTLTFTLLEQVLSD